MLGVPEPTDDEQMRDLYVAYWRLALTAVLLWDEERIEAWVQKILAVFANGGLQHLLHETAAAYIARLLIPNSASKVGREQQQFRYEIERALLSDFNGLIPPAQHPLSRSITAVDAVLRRRGSNLETVRRELA
jgi:hypothetical protein